jgi:hypothetical protein
VIAHASSRQSKRFLLAFEDDETASTVSVKSAAFNDAGCGTGDPGCR